MSSDLSITRVTADGTISAGPCRVKAMSWTGAGTVEFKDGGSGGTSAGIIDLGSTGGYMKLPEGGLRFSTDCYADITTITGLTVFYA